MLDLPAPVLRRFCTLEVEVGPPVSLGPGRFGQRRVVPILGGRISGEISGIIRAGGADWQTISDDGLSELDARYLLETHDGAVIEMVDAGFRHVLPAAPGSESGRTYMRTVARLETGHPGYAWVNRMLFLGTGAKAGETVQIDLHIVE